MPIPTRPLGSRIRDLRDRFDSVVIGTPMRDAVEASNNNLRSPDQQQQRRLLFSSNEKKY